MACGGDLVDLVLLVLVALGRWSSAGGGSMAVLVVLAPLRIVALEHLAEFLIALVDDPALVGALDEFALVVPAVDPGNAVIQEEEADLAHLAVRIGDFAGELAALILAVEQVPAEHATVLDRTGLLQAFTRAAVGTIGFREVPSAAGDVLISSGKRIIPVLAGADRFFGCLAREPFVWGEERLGGNKQIGRHWKLWEGAPEGASEFCGVSW